MGADELQSATLPHIYGGYRSRSVDRNEASMYQLMQLVHGLAGLMNTAHPLSMPVPASAPDYINTPGEFRSPSSALVTALIIGYIPQIHQGCAMGQKATARPQCWRIPVKMPTLRKTKRNGKEPSNQFSSRSQVNQFL